MTIATGVFKQLAYKKETTLNVIPAAGGSQSLRRVTSSLDFKKATYKSNELRADAQRGDFRHGIGSVDGSITGELSGGTYQDFMQSLLRKAWAAGSTTGAQVNMTAAVTVAPAGTVTRAAGSFLTDGFKIGDIVQWTGWVTATANNAHNFIITALTATVMTLYPLDGVALVARAAGDSVTCTVQGKKVWVPNSGFLNESYSIEHFFSDIVQSEVFSGCKPSQMTFRLPSTGMATIETAFMGLGMTPAQAQYFTAPTAITTSGVYAAVNGFVMSLSGLPIAIVTGADITINPNATSGEVIGSNVRPDIFLGAFDVTGNVTMFFQDQTFRDYFKQETLVQLYISMTAANTPNAASFTIQLPAVKFSGAAKDDGEKGLVITLPFTAFKNVAGGAAVNALDTTISIQDSLAV